MITIKEEEDLLKILEKIKNMHFEIVDSPIRLELNNEENNRVCQILFNPSDGSNENNNN